MNRLIVPEEDLDQLIHPHNINTRGMSSLFSVFFLKDLHQYYDITMAIKTFSDFLMLADKYCYL